MKVYSFGREDAPALLLLPGTWCSWESNFKQVVPLLEDDFHVLCVSYDGFDESEPEAEFPTMLDETLKIEGYIKACCGGHIRAAYGCSLGGSFVGLLAARQNIGLDVGILGSSDLDQSARLPAALKSTLVPIIYPLVRDGKFKQSFLNKKMEQKMADSPEYVRAFFKEFAKGRPFLTEKTCRNQYYSDLITPLPDGYDGPTEIHIFYATKMGPQYRARYQQHFAHPVIHEMPLGHEELLMHYPDRWAKLVKQICLGKKD